MKKLLCMTTALFAFASPQAIADDTNMKEKAMKVTENKEADLVQGPEDNFTGNVMIGSMFQSGDSDDYKGAMVHFEPGARTNWHTHPKGQSLLITAGEGRVQSEGEKVRTVTKGDTVWFPADERHWHGAAPDQSMSHVAIQSPDDSDEVVTWMEAVTDAQYNGE